MKLGFAEEPTHAFHASGSTAFQPLCIWMKAKQFLVIVVEPVALRRNEKENPQAQNEKFTRKRVTNLSGILQ